MDYFVQNALDDARKEVLRDNPYGAIRILTSALDNCSEESSKQIYFELGKLYFTVGNNASGLEMLYKAIKFGFNSHIISNYLLRLYYDYDRLQYNYYHNIQLLSDYTNCEFIEDAPDFENLDNYYLFSDSKFVLTANKQKELSLTMPKVRKKTTETDNAIYCIISPQNLTQISNIAKLYPLIHKRTMPLYLMWLDEKEVFPTLTSMTLDTLLKEHRVEILSGINSIEKYFSDIHTFLPTHILDYSNTEDGYEKVKIFLQKRIAVTKKTTEAVRDYYKTRQQLVYDEFKNRQLKLLFIASRFDDDGLRLINSCALVCRKMGYKTASVSEKSSHSYNGNMEMLMIEKTKPTVILACNTFRFQKEDYPDEIIFITMLSSLATLNVEQWSRPLEIKENDFIVVSNNDCNSLVSMGIPKRNIIIQPKISGYFKKLPSLEEMKKDIRLNLFKCDICFLGNYVNKATIFAEMENDVKEQSNIDSETISKIFREIDEAYLSLFFIGKFPFKIECNTEVLKEIFEKNNAQISDYTLSDLSEKALYNLVPALYTTTLLNWLTRNGFESIKIWGDGWYENKQFKQYYSGIVTDNIVLERALGGAKIAIGSSLFTPDYSTIFSAASCGCLYIQNDYFDRKVAITNDLGLTSGVHIDYFKEKEDFLKVLRLYLDDPQKISDVTTNARDAVNMDAVSGDVMKYVFEQISERL